MIPRSMKSLVLALFVLAAAGPAMADVKLPAIFGDHMVLQQEMGVPVWGWAEAGEKITVTFGGQSKSAIADKSGKWSVKLAAAKPGKPQKLTIVGKNTISISDVLVGEVWLGSGQSNMAMTVNRCKDYDKEKAAAKFPQIRMFTVSRKTAVKPQADCTGKWVVCSPETVGSFSATSYFFGRKIHQELKVPVGLVHSSWGGTPVEAWTSLPAQQEVKALAPVLDKWTTQIATYNADAAKKQYAAQLERWKAAAKRAKTNGKKAPRRPRPPVDPTVSQHRPANNYNGMIAPLIPYAIRGALWYQGEHNAGREFPHLYEVQLPTMIRDWRKRWGQGDFQFLFVQLPNFRAVQTQPVEPSGWVTVREGMAKTLAVPNTGMAITLEIGEEKDIHPKNKQDVGLRLALWALGTTYKKDIVYSGALMKSSRVEGNTVRVQFMHIGDGLKARDGEELTGFAIAGKDRKFVAAKAKVDGNAIVIWSDAVKNPAAVRYAWAANPICNLINSAGLPAAPFRTDTWPEANPKSKR